MGRLFGTDGVRGVAGEDLTGQLAMDLAAAAAGLLQDARTGRRDSPTARAWSPSWAGIRGRPVSSSRPPWWPAWPAPGWTCCASA